MADPNGIYLTPDDKNDVKNAQRAQDGLDPIQQGALVRQNIGAGANALGSTLNANLAATGGAAANAIATNPVVRGSAYAGQFGQGLLFGNQPAAAPVAATTPAVAPTYAKGLNFVDPSSGVVGPPANPANRSVSTTFANTAGGANTQPAGVGFPSATQSDFLTRNGIAPSQQNTVAVGGDGNQPDSIQLRRAAIQAGTTPGQYVRLGYDPTSQIYGTSTVKGGPLNSFTGVGVPNPGNTVSISQNDTGAQAVGLGLSPEQAGQAALYRANLGGGGGGYSAADAEADAQQVQRYATSDALAVATRDPRSPFGIASRNIDVDNYPRTPGGRYGGGQPSEGQVLKQDLFNAALRQGGAAEAGAARAGELGRVQAAQAGELARSHLAQDSETQRQQLKDDTEDRRTEAQNRFQQFESGGKLYHYVNGKAVPLTDTNGNQLAGKDVGPKVDAHAVAAYVSGGGDPRSLTPEARASIGLQTPSPTAKDIDLLKKSKGDATTRRQFEDVYGKGSANQYQ